jgi:hypothetical protein
MGKGEFLRELGVMLNEGSGEIPNEVSDNPKAKSKPNSKTENGLDFPKQLGNLEKEFKALKQQMEIMKSKIQEVTNLQKKTPTVPTHRHAELEEAIEKLKAIPSHSHPDLRKAISDLVGRYDDNYKALRVTIDEQKSRIDNLEIIQEDKRKQDNRPFMGRFIPSIENSK